MTYLLDTNTCVEMLRQRKPQVIARFLAVPLERKYLCPIVSAELYFGAYRSADITAGLTQVQTFCAAFRSLPFDETAAQKYGALRADLAQRGELIGPNDMFIAAIALAHEAVLVTHNTREFNRVNGLLLEDWEV
jgi:tRNA(fMet)-specific endonuclease VapC